METAALCKPIQRFADLLRIPGTWVLTGLGQLLAALGSFPHFPQPLRLLHTHLYWRFLECQSIEVTLTQNGHLTHHEIPSVASLRPGGHFPRIGWPVSPEYAPVTPKTQAGVPRPKVTAFGRTCFVPCLCPCLCLCPLAFFWPGNVVLLLTSSHPEAHYLSFLKGCFYTRYNGSWGTVSADSSDRAAECSRCSFRQTPHPQNPPPLWRPATRSQP